MNSETISLSVAIIFYFAIFLAFSLAPVLLTLPFSKRVFEWWRNFALGAIPVMLLLLVPLLVGGGGNAYIGLGGGFFIVIAGVLYSIYFVISLLIIGITAWGTRKHKKNSK
jgi:hypothetical protein